MITVGAQEGKTGSDFEKNLVSICTASGHPSSFHDAIYHFLNNEIDAAYLAISKYLMSEKKLTVRDYAYYIQGACALKKKLWSQAEESFGSISDSFPFNHLKNLKLAALYVSKSDYEKALSLYTEWEKTVTNKEEGAYLKNIYHNIGVCYLHLGNHEKAALYLYKERNLARETKDTLSIIYATMDIANLYYEQYEDEKAIPLFQEAYMLSQATDNLELKQNAALNMAVIEENRDRLKESIRYRKEYEQWKDSLWNRDQVWELAKHEKAMALSEKQKEIAIQQKQIEVKNAQRNLLLISVFSLLSVIGIIVFFLHSRIKKNKLITTQKNTLSHLNDMKNRLFSIISHDLRTPVNTIHYHIDKIKKAYQNDNKKELSHSIEEGFQVTTGMRLLLDKVLNWSLLESGQLFSNSESFPVRRIVEQVVFDYQSFIKAKKLTVHNRILPDIIAYADIESTKVVLRNLLDNAIKYSHENGSLEFEASIVNDHYCCITLRDNGIGISPEKLEMLTSLDTNRTQIHKSTQSGFGLRLCISLLKNNGGDLKILSIPGRGTTMQIKLPSTE